MSQPATPSAAATLVLLRDRAPSGVETLLIQRHAKSKFAGGDYVFPGGKVEADDIPDGVERYCVGLTPEQAAARLGGDLSPRQALGYWVGAVREAFEEVGVLLAYGPAGRFVRFTQDNRARFEAYRAQCHASNQAFFPMLKAEGLTVATDRLTYFAHWITPEESPIRFDTRFFAAVSPPGQEAAADGHEITAVRWLTPAEGLEAFRRKELSLRFPTIKNLELLGSATTAAEMLARLHGREVPAIRPRMLQVDGKPVPILPGDPRWY